MKTRLHSFFIALALLAGVHQAAAQGTAFTYQGQLQNNGSPAGGNYNLTFSLFNTNASGVAIAGPVTNNDVIVSNGLFTVLIDFGSDVFIGETNWLEIAVETNGFGSFTTLAPRQQLTPVPYAIDAESANDLSGTLSASQLTSIGNTNSNYGNFFVGASGNSATSGSDNTADGVQVLNFITSGSYNTANGTFALGNNTSGSYNTANGAAALLSNTNGNYNTANGYETLAQNAGGLGNTANGAEALFSNTGGFFNTANGGFALFYNTNGFFNTANGYQALEDNTSGSNNIALGYQAGLDITTGSSNIDIGNQGLGTDTNIIRIGSGQSQTFIAGVINGNGGGLTNLNASQFASGTGLTIQLNSDGAPNLIGGSSVNFVSGGIVGATIGGGGSTVFDYTNSVTGNFGTVGGGMENTANNDATVGGGAANTGSGGWSTVGGGYGNTASGELATVGGGYVNTASGIGSFIGGGGYDGGTFSGNSAIGNASVIGGGLGNTIQINATDSTIGGGTLNSIQTNAYQSTIAGGNQNVIQVNADQSTIGGGNQNTNLSSLAFIGGGYQNYIQPGNAPVIGGGYQNLIESNSYEATIAGGWTNVIGTNAYQATIGGGSHNTASGTEATVGGGDENQATNYATVPGGFGNTANGIGSFVGGGGWDGTTFSGNSALGNASVVGGGLGNNIPSGGAYAFIGGGIDNTNRSEVATVGGGEFNTASGFWATVGGGDRNSATNSFATVPGGENNIAGGPDSFAAGDNAQATNTGAFVWSDGTGTLTASTNNNSVTMRAGGGYRFFSGTPNTTYAYLAPGSGSWTSMSDRNAKEHFQAVNPLDVLERVAVLPVSTWNYKTQPAGVRHIGPTAQDFKAAFAVGETDTGISTVDEGGVALAAIQGLNQKLQEELNRQDAENAELKQRLEALEKIVLNQKSN
jgi:hypothetical protein